jgi:hypothetical protein
LEKIIPFFFLEVEDAQSIKCDAPRGERGYDAGKTVLGRKRHIDSGNPGGRTAAAVKPLQSLAREYTAEAITAPVEAAPLWQRLGNH